MKTDLPNVIAAVMEGVTDTVTVTDTTTTAESGINTGIKIWGWGVMHLLLHVTAIDSS